MQRLLGANGTRLCVMKELKVSNLIPEDGTSTELDIASHRKIIAVAFVGYSGRYG